MHRACAYRVHKAIYVWIYPDYPDLLSVRIVRTPQDSADCKYLVAELISNSSIYSTSVPAEPIKIIITINEYS